MHAENVAHNSRQLLQRIDNILAQDNAKRGTQKEKCYETFAAKENEDSQF